jgi:hypothetical protein
VERVVQMMIRMLLGRGMRQLLRGRGRRGPAAPREAASAAPERETAERMRQTARLSRHLRR